MCWSYLAIPELLLLIRRQKYCLNTTASDELSGYVLVVCTVTVRILLAMYISYRQRLNDAMTGVALDKASFQSHGLVFSSRLVDIPGASNVASKPPIELIKVAQLGGRLSHR